MSTFLIIAGTWLVSDALYSYALYAHSQSWRGDKQTWLKDHWIRVVRLGLACGILFVGVRNG